MKMSVVCVRCAAPVSLRSAWLMSRACKPTCASPISPSISARGTSAATESMTMRSTASLRTSVSVISSACSPVSGWLTSSPFVSTPSALAYCTSSACSASMNAAMPPARWHSAIACSVSVVLPLDSGPKISTTRPRGSPPQPSAASSDGEPVLTVGSRTTSRSPRRMIAPLP